MTARMAIESASNCPSPQNRPALPAPSRRYRACRPVGSVPRHTGGIGG